jgi:isoquinoline 1-oxidoreductase subunit alpha
VSRKSKSNVHTSANLNHGPRSSPAAGVCCCGAGEPEPAALLSCDIRRGPPPEQRAELAQALIDVCVETLGLRSDRLVVEFTQHTSDEMYRAEHGWATEWTPAEAKSAAQDLQEVGMATTIKINGVDRTVDVDSDTPLLWVLRDVLGMTGTKFGCGMALCGACTVHVDGVATRSCITPIDSIGASEITTIEAIGATPAGAKIQKAWLDREVVQCGYCQSGQIMSASALLASNPHPTDSDIDDAMSGNICRCGTYLRIREAIKQAAQSRGQGG